MVVSKKIGRGTFWKEVFSLLLVLKMKCQKKFLPKYIVGKKIRNSLFSRGAQMLPNSRKKKPIF
jgi:hypothetical protein